LDFLLKNDKEIGTLAMMYLMMAWREEPPLSGAGNHLSIGGVLGLGFWHLDRTS